MRRGIISIMFAMFVLCLWSVPAKATPVTTIYEFVRDESIVAVSGYVPKIYSIEGQFVLNIDFDVGIALFDQVNATLSGEVPYVDYPKPGFLLTNNLDVLFELSQLQSVYVSDTKIDFLLERNIPTFPASDVHLTVTFMDDSLIRMISGFGAPVYDGPWYSLDAVAVVVPEPATILVLCAGMLFVRKLSN